MSSKQEQLFQGVVHFHTTEIARIGAGLDQAERKLAESPLIKGYVEQQRHLHKLKVHENSVNCCLAFHVHDHDVNLSEQESRLLCVPHGWSTIPKARLDV